MEVLMKMIFRGHNVSNDRVFQGNSDFEDGCAKHTGETMSQHQNWRRAKGD